MSDDPILEQAFREAMDQGPPAPSWEDAVTRSVASRPKPRKRMVVVIVATTMALVAIPALALGSRVLIFENATPAPGPVVEEFNSLDKEAPPGLAPHPLPAEARQVMTTALSDGQTSILWVSPSADGGYCLYVAPPGAGPGCTGRVKPLSWGVVAPQGLKGTVVIYGSALSRDATSVELKYKDGSSARFIVVYVTAPIDAAFFMFQLPADDLAKGKQPTQLNLLSAEGKVLSTDDGPFAEFFSGLAPSLR